MSAEKTTPISFDNTEYAFAYKTNPELNKANWLFAAMGNPFLLKTGLALMPFALKWRIPFTKSLIRATLFNQFVGGETLSKTKPVSSRLHDYKVQVILDYGVEGGLREDAFDAATAAFIEVVTHASTQPNIPFISIKVTGIGSFALLEKIQWQMSQSQEADLQKRFQDAIGQLTPTEQSALKRCESRLETICKVAKEKKVGILIDAEESWIQDPVDVLTMRMMKAFNQDICIVYNTIQLYRHDRFSFLQRSHQDSVQHKYLLGVKLVRGAYMEKERARAESMGYVSPVQLDKESTDKDYNAAVDYCLQHLVHISVIIASHNEASNLRAVNTMIQNGLTMHHPHIHFSQLYGMSDNITFNLAKAGCSVSKYLPFGPIKEVIPYLMRRAQENSSVAGQTGRELALIHKEIHRRKK